jgi:hypothetical protein|tara:strand:- start:1128 stop:1334 length:207 start_codon:yes stop_codon:yes gene_type:complete
MKASNKSLLICALLLLAMLLGGCINSHVIFSPNVTAYNRGGNTSAGQSGETLIETEGGGEFTVDPTKP